MIYYNVFREVNTLYYYAEIIRELREDRKLKQEDIAKILGTTQGHYSDYETSRHEMPIRHLIELCKFYSVSADYVLGLKRD